MMTKVKNMKWCKYKVLNGHKVKFMHVNMSNTIHNNRLGLNILLPLNGVSCDSDVNRLH